MPRRGKPGEPLQYEKVMTQIIHLIETGSLKPGDKIPSIRAMTRQLHVGHTTAVRAYEILEAQGWIDSRPKSGFYVAYRPDNRIVEPETYQPETEPTKVSIRQLMSDIAQTSGDPVYLDFGLAAPVAETLPLEILKRTAGRVLRHTVPEVFLYDMPPGLLPLRQEIAKYAVHWEGRIAPDEILITSGTMEAIDLCLRTIAKPGDTIAIESPTFYSFLQILEALGLFAVEIPTSPKTGLDLDAFEHTLKQQSIQGCLLMPNFNNPTGALMPDEQKQRLAKLLVQYQVPLIENDIYGDLHFGEKRPKPVKAFDEDGLVLLCSSFAKTLCPGFRVGYIINHRYQTTLQRLKYSLSVSAPPLWEHVITDLFKSGQYYRIVKQQRQRFQQLMTHYVQTIHRYFPENTKISRPQGGFLLWVEMPDPINALELFTQAFRQKIIIAPGPMFSVKEGYRNCIRLTCTTPWSAETEKALKILGTLAKGCL